MPILPLRASLASLNSSLETNFVPRKATDIKYPFRAGQSRLDKISQQYYNTPYFGWLIMMANPEYGGLEWNIPDNAIIVIPYPLNASIQDYNNAIKTRFYYYGR